MRVQGVIEYLTHHLKHDANRDASKVEWLASVAAKLEETVWSEARSQREYTERINRKLALNNERMLFASLFIGLLDTRDGLLRYANAGHPRPVLVRRSQTPTLLKVPQNPIAGIDPTVDYSLAEARL